MRTPWGTAQNVFHLAEGVIEVETASHGGIKLDRKRNARMPEAFRRSGGWYEEDCEYALVLVSLPEALNAMAFRLKKTPTDLREVAWETVRNWFPDEYEQVTGETLREGDSHERDRALFHERHRNDWVVICAIGNGDKVRVTATLGGKREFGAKGREFWVSDAEYSARSRFGFVIDLDRHKEIRPESS